MIIFDYIKRVLAGVLLFVFALSITPKRFLHNVFAKHIDSGNKKTDNTPYQLNLSGYNCDDDNLVAQSAFDAHQSSFEFALFSAYSGYIFSNISFSSSQKIFSSLRGPPVNI